MIDERYALGTPLAGPQAPGADAAGEIAAQRASAETAAELGAQG